MDFKNIPIGVEIYTVREPFQEDPEGALAYLKKIGYDGVEFFNYNFEAERLKEALEANDLACYGILTGWDNLQPDKIEQTLDYNRKLGNRNIAIGSLRKELTKDKATLYKCIEYFNELLRILKAEGFTMGYHNHNTDFELVEGKTIWDHVFENTPQDFNMVLDTGNAMDGGADPVEIIRRYPHRQEWMHIKPYSRTNFWERGYGSMIGEDDHNWPELLHTCVELGGTKVLTIEFGNRNRYQPFYGAYLCYTNLKKILSEMK